MKKLVLLTMMLMSIYAVLAQSRQIKGKVTDKSTGAPLADVSVVIKGTSNGTRTDESGNFTLSVNKAGKVDIEISLINYGIQQITTDGSLPLNITMDKESKSLDEVVVIGYGTVKKRDLTGSVVSIKNDEIKKVPASNVMESVQGKIAGVDIVRTSGSAGAKPLVTVRGNRSLPSSAGGADNGPLYIVDGIQYNNYEDINASDIASMEVLKDASSTAIYGSRGANGVIIITTKRGNTGKVKVSANTYYGVSEITGYPTPMTGPQYAELKRQAYRTANPTFNPATDDAKVFTSPADLAAVIAGTSTYWPGLLLQKGSQQDYGIGVAGGTEKTKAYFSFDYFKEEGLLNNDQSNRYSLRLNIDQFVTNTLKVGVQSQLTYYNQNIRADNILTVANKVIPYFTPYNADGTIPKFPGNGNQVNPLFEEMPGAYINQINTTRILSTAFAEWRPFKSLSFRSNLGIANSSSRAGTFQDANTISRALSTGSSSSALNSLDANLTWENILNWQHRFNKHNLEVTAISSYLSNRNDNSFASGTGQLLGVQSFYALQNNPANVTITSGYTGSNLFSGAFRINYGFKEKYLLTLTGRADGASVLAPQNRWSFFPSAAAAWRISDESFMKTQNVFNDLKLRLSYGIAGNSAVRPYQTQSVLDLIPFSWNDINALAYGINPQIGNKNLNWELTGTQDIGIDFSLFKSRISGSFDYYDSRTHDLLYLALLPASTGGQTIESNVGKTRNSGFEIALRTINVKTKDFSWSTNLTYTRNKERIVFLPNGNDVGNSLFIGSPVISFYDYRKLGIWQTADSAAARAFGYKPGDIRVEDIDGDKKITATNDRVVVGSAVPKYSFGFSNDLKYKSFDLNVYVFGRIGQTFVSAYANKFEPNAIENGANVDYWTPENPTNDYPRPNLNISRAAMPFATTLGYKDGSFVKIRNITLGYTLPTKLASRFNLGSLRLYVSAKNYFTFAKVDDYDPEGGGSFERPLTKLILTGVTLDF